MKPADLLIESFCDRTELAPYCHRQTSTAGTLLPQTDQTAGTLLPSESESWYLTTTRTEPTPFCCRQLAPYCHQNQTAGTSLPQTDQTAGTLLPRSESDSWHLTAIQTDQKAGILLLSESDSWHLTAKIRIRKLVPYYHQDGTDTVLLQTAGTLLPSESESWHLTAIQTDQKAGILLPFR